MTTEDQYRSMLSGEARPVDVTSIEHELTGLWKAAAEDNLEGQPVVRSCVLNLVAYAPDEETAAHVGEVITQVAVRHPSRSIVVVANPDQEGPYLQASIAAHCQVPPTGGRQVCSEQINLTASGQALDEVHGTVLPLLVPDLPVYVWWHDEPPASGHLFRELVSACDHLVVDSADYAPERAEDALRRLRQLAERQGIALSDLNWSRLNHWRELVAQFFDNPPASDYLSRLDGVRVEIASTHGREPDLTEGLLMVGWLASRLGWTPADGVHKVEGGAVGFDLRRRSDVIPVRINPDPDHPGDGLHAISLRAGEATFSVSRMADDHECGVATAELPGGGYSRVVRLDLPPEAALLGSELETLGPDSIFEEALAMAARLPVD